MILWFKIAKATQLSLFDAKPPTQRKELPTKQVLVHEPGGKTHMQSYHVSNTKDMPAATSSSVKEATKKFRGAVNGNLPEVVVFDPPLVGSTGYSLEAYEWVYKLDLVYDKKTDDLTTKPVSDWEKHKRSVSGHKIVHQFQMKDPSGNVLFAGADMVPRLMGLSLEKKAGFSSLNKILLDYELLNRDIKILENRLNEHVSLAINYKGRVPDPKVSYAGNNGLLNIYSVSVGGHSTKIQTDINPRQIDNVKNHADYKNALQISTSKYINEQITKDFPEKAMPENDIYSLISKLDEKEILKKKIELQIDAIKGKTTKEDAKNDLWYFKNRRSSIGSINAIERGLKNEIAKKIMEVLK